MCDFRTILVHLPLSFFGFEAILRWGPRGPQWVSLRKSPCYRKLTQAGDPRDPTLKWPQIEKRPRVNVS